MSPANPANEPSARSAPIVCYCEDREQADLVRILTSLSIRDQKVLGGLLERLSGLESDEALSLLADVEAVIRAGRRNWAEERDGPTPGRRHLPT
jgi:hypothetical protein